MPRPIEPCDLYAVSTRPPRVEWAGGFGGLGAAVDYLRAHPDERAYVLTDAASGIRAVALFDGGDLLLLTGGGEVNHDREAGGRAAGDQPELGL